MRADFEFIDRRAGEEVAVDADAFHHFLAEFFLDDFLHCSCDELQITLISDLKFNFVPDVRKERPRIVVNDRVEHFLIWKSDRATARVIAGNILTSEFPQCRVEITDVDHIAGSIVDLDTIADPERLADENIDPGNETLHWCLHGQPNDNRSHTEGSKRGVPIHKNYRHGNERD